MCDPESPSVPQLLPCNVDNYPCHLHSSLKIAGRNNEIRVVKLFEFFGKERCTVNTQHPYYFKG